MFAADGYTVVSLTATPQQSGSVICSTTKRHFSVGMTDRPVDHVLAASVGVRVPRRSRSGHAGGARLCCYIETFLTSQGEGPTLVSVREAVVGAVRGRPLHEDESRTMASLRAARCRRVQRSGRRAGADARAGRAGRQTRRVRRCHFRAPHFAGGVAVRCRYGLRPRRRPRVGGPPARGHRCLRAHGRGRAARLRPRRDGACLSHRAAVGPSRIARGAGRPAIPRRPPMATRPDGWCGATRLLASGDQFAALRAYLRAAQLAPGDAGIAREVSGILVRLGAPFGAGIQARTRDLGIEAAQAAAFVTAAEVGNPAQRFAKTDEAIARIDALLAEAAAATTPDSGLMLRLRRDRVIALRESRALGGDGRGGRRAPKRRRGDSSVRPTCGGGRPACAPAARGGRGRL